MDSGVFEICSTPLSYLGAHAKGFIPKGTLVLEESPIFVLDAPWQCWLFQRMASGTGPDPVESDDEDTDGEQNANKQKKPPATEEAWLDRVIRGYLKNLRSSEKAKFWALANTRPELPTALGVFATNAVATKPDLGGMFLTLSRFNSSCRPNLTRPIWNPETHTIRLEALVDIEPGQELVWSYLNQDYEYDSITMRREQIKKVFGFVCYCTGCRLEEEQATLSDSRTKELRYLTEAKGGEQRGLTSFKEKMLQLCELDCLWDPAQRLRKSLL